MGQLNVAVIGCGVWGGNHARVYNTLPGVKLVAISDIEARRAQYTSELYGVPGFTDTLRVLRDPNIDAVSICTPTCTHEYIASKAWMRANTCWSRSRSPRHHLCR
jgi:UDP-N-acetylglucosamine 3-dehydrogenase